MPKNPVIEAIIAGTIDQLPADIDPKFFREPDANGCTPLHHAAVLCDSQMSWLLNHRREDVKATFNQKDNLKRTPFSILKTIKQNYEHSNIQEHNNICYTISRFILTLTISDQLDPKKSPNVLETLEKFYQEKPHTTLRALDQLLRQKPDSTLKALDMLTQPNGVGFLKTLAQISQEKQAIATKNSVLKEEAESTLTRSTPPLASSQSPEVRRNVRIEKTPISPKKPTSPRSETPQYERLHHSQGVVKKASATSITPREEHADESLRSSRPMPRSTSADSLNRLDKRNSTRTKF